MRKGDTQPRLHLLPQVGWAAAGDKAGPSGTHTVEGVGGGGRASPPGTQWVRPLLPRPCPQLLFQEDLEITHMYSAEGEEVKLSFSIYPSSNVEDWLREVERSMKASVRDIIERAIKAYPTVSRASHADTASVPPCSVTGLPACRLASSSSSALTTAARRSRSQGLSGVRQSLRLLEEESENAPKMRHAPDNKQPLWLCFRHSL